MYVRSSVSLLSFPNFLIEEKTQRSNASKPHHNGNQSIFKLTGEYQTNKQRNAAVRCCGDCWQSDESAECLCQLCTQICRWGEKLTQTLCAVAAFIISKYSRHTRACVCLKKKQQTKKTRWASENTVRVDKRKENKTCFLTQQKDSCNARVMTATGQTITENKWTPIMINTTNILARAFTTWQLIGFTSHFQQYYHLFTASGRKTWKHNWASWNMPKKLLNLLCMRWSLLCMRSAA